MLRAQLAVLNRKLEDGHISTERVRTGKRKGCSTG
ncbi:gas vesicle protein GvpG [Streptomyces atratus]